MQLLEEGSDVSKRDENGVAPIHAIVSRKESKEKLDCLMSLLVHSDSSDLDINITTVDDTTALHITVKVGFYFLEISIASNFHTDNIDTLLYCSFNEPFHTYFFQSLTQLNVLSRQVKFERFSFEGMEASM